MIQHFLHPKAGTLGADKGVGLFKKSIVMALLYPMVLPPLIIRRKNFFVVYHAAAYGKVRLCTPFVPR
jgi:hypothetical protein